MRLYQLLYISDATEPMDTDALEEMVERFRRRNRERGVTGVLFYSAGHFIQLLEGKRETIESLFKTIQADPRHRNVRRLLIAPADRRIFEVWDMGLLNLDERSELDQERLVRLVREAERPRGRAGFAPLPLRLLAEFCMMLPRPTPSNGHTRRGKPPPKS
ncbi:MAG: BLUF domain-containing protein [Planctomycetota bacterium]